MNELQKKQLEILKEFIRVCEKHHLTYWLIGGSALGAARHQGFIPWDDDIDVGMPRKDYEEYLKLQYEYEGTPYFIQSWRSDPRYMYTFSKLRDSSTTYIESFWACHHYNHGVWVDIFPFDGLSNKVKPREKYAWRLIWTYPTIYLTYLGSLFRPFHKKTFFKDLGLNIVACLFWIWNPFHLWQHVLEHREKKYPFETSPMVGHFYAFNPKKEALPRDLLDEFVDLPFEDITAKVPKDYDKYLTLIFGDWRKLPPEDKREGHHKNAGYSLTQGYEEYILEHKL